MTIAARGRILKIAYPGFETGPGQPWHFQEIKGLDDMPDLQTGDTPIPGVDGMLFGEDSEGKRVIELTLITYADAKLPMPEQQDQVDAAIQLLRAAFQRRRSDDLPFDITYENAAGLQTVRTVICRPRGRVIPHKYEDLQVKAICTVNLEAADPRVYGPEMEASVGLSLGLGRRFYPRIHPWSYGSGGSGGRIAATNDGSRESYPIAVIRGPVKNPGIIHVQSGLRVRVNLELTNVDHLTLDFAPNQRMITLNDAASRYYAITGTSSWWALQPGANTIQFVADFYQPEALLTLYWRAAD